MFTNNSVVIKMPKVFPEEYKQIIKSKILDAAIKVFSVKGYQKTKIDEIATEAEMSKTTIYKYFDSKQDILIAISSKQNVSEMFKSAFEGRDYPESFQAFFDMMIALNGGLKVTFELIVLASTDQDLQKIYKKVYDEKLNEFKVYLKKQQDKKNIRDDVDPETLAYLLMALSTEITMQLVLGTEKSEVNKKWNKSINTILKV
jgi:TetR/AcrR family transcriptional regulator, fatty acid metabolism regulator protein